MSPCCCHDFFQARVPVATATPAMASIWFASLLIAACLPTALGTCRVSQCHDLEPFLNCTIDKTAAGGSRAGSQGHCSDFLAIKFLVMSPQRLLQEPLRYVFSDLVAGFSFPRDRQSQWALDQLKRTESLDMVTLQPPIAREKERLLAARAARAPLAFGIQTPRIDCSVYVDLANPVPLLLPNGMPAKSLRRALLNIEASGCQNYSPFLDPNYNTAPNI